MHSSHVQSFLAGAVCSAALIYVYLKVQGRGCDRNASYPEESKKKSVDKNSDKMGSKKSVDTIIMPEKKKEEPTPEKSEEMAEEVEEKREYLDQKVQVCDTQRRGCDPDASYPEESSKKNADTIIMPEKKKNDPPEELEGMAEEVEEKREEDPPGELEGMAEEVEEKREAYLDNEKGQNESEEKMEKSGDAASSPTSQKAPEIVISEEDCISILDTLAKRYAGTEVQEALKQAALDYNFVFNKGYIIRSKQILAPLQKDLFEKYGYWGSGHLDNILDNDVEPSDDKAKLVTAIASDMSSEFEESLDNLLLIGVGLREKSSNKMYSLAVYSGDDTKAKIISDMTSDENESTSTLRAALKSSNKTTFLLQLIDDEIGVQEMSGEFVSLIFPRTSDNSFLAKCSSLMYKAGSFMETEDAFACGTTFKLECVGTEVKFSVDGNEVGVFQGLTEVFCDAFLDQETVGPSLQKSVIQNCCDTSTAKKVADTMAHDQALGKLKKDVRRFAKKNKEIADKMDLCRRLTMSGEITAMTDNFQYN